MGTDLDYERRRTPGVEEVSFFPIIIREKRTVQPRDAFENTVFKLGFEIVKF
jgi:hypothetical protein